MESHPFPWRAIEEIAEEFDKEPAIRETRVLVDGTVTHGTPGGLVSHDIDDDPDCAWCEQYSVAQERAMKRVKARRAARGARP